MPTKTPNADFDSSSLSQLFFLARLVLLNEANWTPETNAPIRALLDAAVRLVTDSSPQPTAGVMVMALAFGANFFATASGRAVVAQRDVSGALTDAAVRGIDLIRLSHPLTQTSSALHHARAEVRIMASAVLANLALLLLTTNHSTVDDGLEQAVLILCGAMEGISTEENEVSISLHSICILISHRILLRRL